MKLILVRHGETEENVDNIVQGQLPGTLTSNGKSQIKKLAKRLKDEDIAHIYSSDLKRAVDTAKEIAQYHPGVPLDFREDIRESHAGEWTGLHADDVDMDNRPDSAEDLDDLKERAESFLHHVYHAHEDETILVVGHGGINKVLITILKDEPIEHFHDLEDLSNAGVTVFNIQEEEGNHELKMLDCTAHL